MRALITGITGQDGSYLAELLLEKGYEVHGLVRPKVDIDRSWIGPIHAYAAARGSRLLLHTGDLTDPGSLQRVMQLARPDEVYHLAGQSHVGLSFECPESTCELIGMATVHLLELARAQNPGPKFFFASSSEVFGQPSTSPQDESTPMLPVSPYGCAKAFATQMVAVYRRTFGLFASSGILFNHESPRRGEDFVTKKICRGAAAIKLGLQKELILGNTAAQRDWGHARDYVEGMWRALQTEQPADFVFATGHLHSVQEVVEEAFATVELDWSKYLRFDPRLARPAESRQLVGDAGKARRLLGWEPRTTFHELIAEMTQSEMAACRVRSRG